MVHFLQYFIAFLLYKKPRGRKPRIVSTLIVPHFAPAHKAQRRICAQKRRSAGRGESAGRFGFSQMRGASGGGARGGSRTAIRPDGARRFGTGASAHKARDLLLHGARLLFGNVRLFDITVNA